MMKSNDVDFSPVKSEKIVHANSHPIIEREFVLLTKLSQDLYRRSFEYLASAHVNVSVIARISTEIKSFLDDEFADKADDTMETIYQECINRLQGESDRLDAVLESNGCADRIRYSSPKKIKVVLRSPADNHFFQCTTLLDDVVSKIDTLWMAGLIRNKVKISNTMMWKQVVAKTINRTIALSNNLRAEIRRKENEYLSNIETQKTNENSIALEKLKSGINAVKDSEEIPDESQHEKLVKSVTADYVEKEIEKESVESSTAVA